MNTTERKNELRCVYVAEFSDGYAYVGTASDYKQRIGEHLFGGGNSQVFQHKRHTGLVPTFSQISDYIPAKEADRMEYDKTISLASEGKKILNVMKPGGYCGLDKKKVENPCPEKEKFKEEHNKNRYETVSVGFLPVFSDETEHTFHARKSSMYEAYFPRDLFILKNDLNSLEMRILLLLFDAIYRHSEGDYIFSKDEIKSKSAKLKITIPMYYTSCQQYKKTIEALDRITSITIHDTRTGAKMNPFREMRIRDGVKTPLDSCVTFVLYTPAFRFAAKKQDYIMYDKLVMDNLLPSKNSAKLYLISCRDICEMNSHKIYELNDLKGMLGMEEKRNAHFVHDVILSYCNRTKELYDNEIEYFYTTYQTDIPSEDCKKIALIYHTRQ